MAITAKTENKKSTFGPQLEQPLNEYTLDNSVSGIIRNVKWPRFTVAVKYAGSCLLASAIISIILYFLDFGVNNILSKLL